VLSQNRRGETGRLSPFENGGGDVGGEVGEAENLAVVGSVQVLALGQIGKLAGSAVQQPFVEPVSFDKRLDQTGVGLRGWANGSMWSITIRTSLPSRRNRTG
jgi:hypothetical protein